MMSELDCSLAFVNSSATMKILQLEKNSRIYRLMQSLMHLKLHDNHRVQLKKLWYGRVKPEHVIPFA